VKTQYLWHVFAATIYIEETKYKHKVTIITNIETRKKKQIIWIVTPGFIASAELLFLLKHGGVDFVNLLLLLHIK